MSKAWILAENLLESASSVTASSEAAGYPARNAYDGVTTTFWSPTAAGFQVLLATFSSNVTVDTFCFAAHNFASAGALVAFQYSNDSGSTWLNAFTPFTPAVDNSCIMQRFTPITGTWFRLLLDITTAPAYLGVMAIGQAINTYRGMPVGWVSPFDSRTSEAIPNTTEGGAFAGRSIILRGAESSIKVNYVPMDWIRSTWRPFIKRAEGHPFFFAWNLDDFPAEVVFAQFKFPQQAPQQSEFGTLNIDAPFVCLGVG